MFYRVKQFLWAFSAYWKEIDYKFVNNNLDKDEKELFEMLSKCDRYHCFRVAKDAEEIIRDENITNEKKIIKACLLHDIGKIDKSPNPIEKGILVILDKVTSGNLRKFNKIKKIDVYYNHPIKGVEILNKGNKYPKDFIEAIEKHHIDKKTNNKILEIIKYCDNKN